MIEARNVKLLRSRTSLGHGPRGEGGGGDESEYESKDWLEGKDGRCCCMWNQSSLRVPPTG
jgi:hypothetical protein